MGSTLSYPILLGVACLPPAMISTRPGLAGLAAIPLAQAPPTPWSKEFFQSGSPTIHSQRLLSIDFHRFSCFSRWTRWFPTSRVHLSVMAIPARRNAADASAWCTTTSPGGTGQGWGLGERWSSWTVLWTWNLSKEDPEVQKCKGNLWKSEIFMNFQ